MKPIYHAEQIISAYETAMGLPEAMRMTNDDGTFNPQANTIRAEVAVTMVQMARVMGR